MESSLVWTMTPTFRTTKKEPESITRVHGRTRKHVMREGKTDTCVVGPGNDDGCARGQGNRMDMRTNTHTYTEAKDLEYKATYTGVKIWGFMDVNQPAHNNNIRATLPSNLA